MNDEKQWLLCPICRNKTQLQVIQDRRYYKEKSGSPKQVIVYENTAAKGGEYHE